MRILLCFYVAIAGALTSVESGSNAKLATALGGPWWAAVIFSVLTLVLLGGAALCVAGPFPLGQMGGVPWWAWTGGLVSALYIMSMMMGPRVLGAGLFTGLTVSAAIIASVALDNFGLVGFPVHHAGVGRLLGAALMVIGLALVAAF